MYRSCSVEKSIPPGSVPGLPDSVSTLDPDEAPCPRTAKSW